MVSGRACCAPRPCERGSTRERRGSTGGWVRFLARGAKFLARVTNFLARVAQFLARGAKILARECQVFWPGFASLLLLTRVAEFLARGAKCPARTASFLAGVAIFCIGVLVFRPGLPVFRFRKESPRMTICTSLQVHPDPGAVPGRPGAAGTIFNRKKF